MTRTMIEELNSQLIKFVKKRLLEDPSADLSENLLMYKKVSPARAFVQDETLITIF